MYAVLCGKPVSTHADNRPGSYQTDCDGVVEVALLNLGAYPDKNWEPIKLEAVSQGVYGQYSKSWYSEIR